MVEVVAWRTLGLDLTKCQTNGCEVGSPRSNQLGTLRRDGKQFVEKRRRKKREKERKKRKKGRKENKKKERKEKGRRKLLHPLFQIWVDQELILHTSRGGGSFLFGYFLVWGNGNGIWLSLHVLCSCLNSMLFLERNVDISMHAMMWNLLEKYYGCWILCTNVYFLEN